MMRAIVVHGVEIPEALIAKEAQNHPGRSIAESRTAAGHALATKALLLHRATELGLEPEPELDEDGREETAEAALVRAVLEAEIEITLPTDAECRRVYDGQRAKFRSPALYEAAHILIEPRSDADEDVALARATADRLSRILAEDVSTFAELARDHSDCPSATTGGSLGQLQRGDLVAEVEDALLGLAPGQVAAEPVRSRFGWHILKLERRIEGRDLPFDIAAEQIRLHLESRAWTVAASRYVAALAEAASDKGIALAFDERGGVTEGSACLGDLIGNGLAAERLVPWLEATDPHVAHQLRDTASATGMEPSAYVRAVVADFVDRATDEHWTRLISAARDASDPAQAALAEIMKANLAAECGGRCTSNHTPVADSTARTRDRIG
ncbi:peptidylprolyl isomerase [Sphingomonas caeni]|uniref:peptidylprolyl isomerase n=1 Tax=Sphingomonas caeni TaxID=2984949 RepID=UPI00222EAA60|nr:peptidylprolyl isomerase [Sphingomonas caeni]